jgi:hypothetical protein
VLTSLLLRAPFGTLSSPPPHPVSEMMKIRQSPGLIEDTEEHSLSYFLFRVGKKRLPHA